MQSVKFQKISQKYKYIRPAHLLGAEGASYAKLILTRPISSVLSCSNYQTYL
jgi:hypothetical protein